MLPLSPPLSSSLFLKSLKMLPRSPSFHASIHHRRLDMHGFPPFFFFFCNSAPSSSINVRDFMAPWICLHFFDTTPQTSVCMNTRPTKNRVDIHECISMYANILHDNILPSLSFHSFPSRFLYYIFLPFLFLPQTVSNAELSLPHHCHSFFFLHSLNAVLASLPIHFKMQKMCSRLL